MEPSRKEAIDIPSLRESKRHKVPPLDDRHVNKRPNATYSRQCRAVKRIVGQPTCYILSRAVTSNVGKPALLVSDAKSFILQSYTARTWQHPVFSLGLQLEATKAKAVQTVSRVACVTTSASHSALQAAA